MSDDLVQRLRTYVNERHQHRTIDQEVIHAFGLDDQAIRLTVDDVCEAADRIEQLEAELARLRGDRPLSERVSVLDGDCVIVQCPVGERRVVDRTDGDRLLGPLEFDGEVYWVEPEEGPPIDVGVDPDHDDLFKMTCSGCGATWSCIYDFVETSAHAHECLVDLPEGQER